jgi:hypothetical protein
MKRPPLNCWSIVVAPDTMKVIIMIAAVLFLVTLTAHPCAAQDDAAAEDHLSSLRHRGLLFSPYKVVLDQLITNPEVIFGMGNDNGNWAIATNSAKRVSIALRAKEAFIGNTPPNPKKLFEYIFDTGPGALSASSRPKWNFDYEFDSDVDCAATSGNCNPLSKYIYEVAMDVNPTIDTTWIKIDPINQPYADHSFGKIDTTPITDIVAGDALAYANVINGVTLDAGGRLHVAQNSFSYAFLFFPPFNNPDFTVGAPNSLINTEGIYDVILSIKDKQSGKVLAKSAIRVLVKDPTKCGGSVGRGKCFPTDFFDCVFWNLWKYDMFFNFYQFFTCKAFVAGLYP